MTKTSKSAKKNNGKKATCEPRPFRAAMEAAHEAFMKKLSMMSAHEIFLTAVEVGIYTKSGKLRKPYAPQPDDHLAR